MFAHIEQPRLLGCLLREVVLLMTAVVSDAKYFSYVVAKSHVVNSNEVIGSD